MVNNMVGKAFVVLVLLLIGVGALLGTKVGDIEVLHPRAAEGEARQAAENLRHQQELNRIEEARRKAEMQLALNQQREHVEREQEMARQLNDVKVFASYALTVTGALILLALGLSICYALIRWVLRTISSPTPPSRLARQRGSSEPDPKPRLLPATLHPNPKREPQHNRAVEEEQDLVPKGALGI